MTARGAARRTALVALGLLVFILALELLKQGAGGIAPLLRTLHASGVSGCVGFVWLMGEALIRLAPGRLRRAELHWYEAHGVEAVQASLLRAS